MPRLYKDAAQSIKARTDDLLSEMAAYEKMQQLNCIMSFNCVVPDMKTETPCGVGEVALVATNDHDAREIAEFCAKVQDYYCKETRLGIPALIHIEALTAPQFKDGTVFPAAVAMGATWNPENVRTLAQTASKQLYATGIRHAFSPVVDLVRDQRWGRIAETYGEDPALAAAMGVAYVQGMQGKDLENRVAATAKHFIGYSASDGGLNMAGCSINERDLREIFAKPYQAMITEAGVASVMNAYTSIDRVPVASSRKLLTGLLRGELGFDGVVVADYISVERLYDAFHTARDYEDAGWQAIFAGLDVEVPNIRCYTKKLAELFESGSLPVSILDDAVERVLKLKFKLGLFEQPYPDMSNADRVFFQKKDAEAAAEAFAQSVVMVKNNGALPLEDDGKTIAVIGPHVGRYRTLFGSYTFAATQDVAMMSDAPEADDYTVVYRQYEIDSRTRQRFPGDIAESPPELDVYLKRVYPDMQTLDDAIARRAENSNVIRERGCEVNTGVDGGFKRAVEAAERADIVILTLGGKSGWGERCNTGEGTDNAHIGLPAIQKQLAETVLGAGRPTIILHTGARCLCEPDIVQRASAVLECWTPSVSGAEAIAQILFGARVPVGKMPVTTPRHSGQMPVVYNHLTGSSYTGAGNNTAMDNDFGYIDDTAHPIWCFGHGLSYTDFEYSDLRFDKRRVSAADTLRISLDIENVGERDGVEIAQLYAKDPTATVIRPNQELIGFARVPLKAKEKKTVAFELRITQLAFLDINMLWKVEAGEIIVRAGKSSGDIQLESSFEITADEYIDCRARGFYTVGRVED